MSDVVRAAQYGDGYENHVHSPINALPPPPSPRSPRTAERVTAKIFGNKLASKSATKLSSSSAASSRQQLGSNNVHAAAEYSPSRSPANANANSYYLNAAAGGNSIGGGGGGGVGVAGSGLGGIGSAVNKSSPDVSVSHPHSGQSSPRGDIHAHTHAGRFDPLSYTYSHDNDQFQLRQKRKRRKTHFILDSSQQEARDIANSPALPISARHSHSSSRERQTVKVVEHEQRRRTPTPRFFDSASASTSPYLQQQSTKTKFNSLTQHPVTAADFSPDRLKSSSTLPTEKEKDRSASRKTQHKFGNFLNRKSSLRGDEHIPPTTDPSHPPASSSSSASQGNNSSTGKREKQIPGPIKAITQPIDVPVRTAPVEKERGFRSAMNSALRNRSLDRADTTSPESSVNERAGVLSSSSQTQHSHSHAHKPSSLGPNAGGGSGSGSVMSGIRSGGTRAAEGISKARRGILGGLGKLGRSGSSHERELPGRSSEPYELKVLILPLEEQARVTRIAKRLHYCKGELCLSFWISCGRRVCVCGECADVVRIEQTRPSSGCRLSRIGVLIT